MAGGQTPSPGQKALGRILPLFCCHRTKPSEDFFKPVLLTLSDPRGGVLTLTDQRMAEKKGIMT